MTTHQEWDLAAPAAIIEAAGGVISSETGLQIKLGRGLIDFQYVIASNGAIHKQLQTIIGF
jgi:fructose-1,6-bisphosphatase/inositol monophosphatase family enzyme